MNRLEETISRLPRQPGVYLFKDADGEVLYVGKAADLRARARSYVQPSASLPTKTAVMVRQAVDLDYIVTATAAEALLLESNLIKEHDPRFNVILRADRFPAEVLVPFDFEDRPLIEQVVRERAGRVVKLHVPQRGEKAKQVRLAEKNARYLLEERRLKARRETERASEAVLELQSELGLRRIPREIACVDVSTIQGRDSVGSVVTFRNGKPYKTGYRRFKIKYVEGQDDFAMMAEVVERYVRNLLDHDEPLPDLLVIDGGKGQLNAALAVLDETGVRDEMDVVGLAKREEELFLPGRKDPVWLPRRSPALQLVQHVRNEAHRFAITYHRKVRSKRTIASELDEIEGIGPKRRAALLHHFGSVARLREEPVEEIAKVPGFSDALAARVKAALEIPEEAGTSA